MIGQLTFDKILGRACLLQLICKSKKGKWGSTQTKQNIRSPFFTLKAKHVIVQIGGDAYYHFPFQLMSYKTPTLISASTIHNAVAWSDSPLAIFTHP